MWEAECKHQHTDKAPRCDVRQAERLFSLLRWKRGEGMKRR